MNLLIHDLSPAEWAEVADRYAGWDVIGPSDRLRACAGCFGCWIKTPGLCVLPDGFDRIAVRMHAADEIVVLSRCTFGGFSSFVKNVFDRSIGGVQPFFGVVEGEMHHRRRYPGEKPLTVRFRGAGISKEEQALARRYVAAVCRNLRGRVREVSFRSCAPEPVSAPAAAREVRGTVLLNCSARGKNAVSHLLLDTLADALGHDCERLDLVSYRKDPDALIARLREAETIVLGMGLYVDGVPSHVLRLMERLAREPAAGNQRVFVVGNMGLYESRQQQNLLGAVRLWCEKAGFRYAGAVAVGAGEMIGRMPDLLRMAKGPAKTAANALRALAETIRTGGTAPDCYADPHAFPRAMYIAAANFSWTRHGLSRRALCARPELE